MRHAPCVVHLRHVVVPLLHTCRKARKLKVVSQCASVLGPFPQGLLERAIVASLRGVSQVHLRDGWRICPEIKGGLQGLWPEVLKPR